MSSDLPFLARLLRQRLTVTNANQQRFGLGPAVEDQIVTTNRFILLLGGELQYTIGQQTRRLTSGTQFFVPAWVRRVWSVPRRAPCEIIWCEFDDEGDELNPPTGLSRMLSPLARAKEKYDFLELIRLGKLAARPRTREAALLQMEGELKAMLARFWAEASDRNPSHAKNAARLSPVHPQVKSALRWLKDHYHKQDALAGLYRETDLTPNYFRRHFQATLKCTPQEYIQQLRLRRARYLLHETDLLQKQIAMEVGYPDARYFSRLYHRFWGRAPRRERRV